MRLKLQIVSILIISCGSVFGAFELDFLPESGVVHSFTNIDQKESMYNYRGGLNLQLGYKFPANNRKHFRGASLLFETGLSVTPISVYVSKNYQHRVDDNIGINTGLALKFIFSPNENSKQDLVFGVASGARFIPVVIDEAGTKPNKVPISPYVRLFFEDRIYGNDKFALVIGLGVYYEYMIFDKNDRGILFGGYNVNELHSIGQMITIGFHFGKR